MLDVIFQVICEALKLSSYRPWLLKTAWLTFGFSAQGLFMARFFVQWLASERAGRSYIPNSFWYLSIVGSAMLLSYAVLYLSDPVIMVGQSTGLFIYVRNLLLIKSHKKKLAAEAAAESEKGAAPSGAPDNQEGNDE